MCGVFGFIGVDGAKMSMSRIKKIAADTEARGPHAFGFAWIDTNGHLRMFKQTGAISDHLSLLGMAKGARLLIGHCRWATHGDPENNLNNHPFACDGGWLVHNGVVSDHEDLIEKHDLWATTDCDSEVLALMYEKFYGKMLNRAVATANATQSRKLVMVGLWARSPRLLILRRNNPLWRSRLTNGEVYFASRPYALPKTASEMKNRTAEMWSPAGLLGVAKGIH